MRVGSEKNIIKEIKKRNNVVIRISKYYFIGHPFIEIRQYYLDKEGVYRASKKGVSFSPTHLDEVIDGLVELKKDIQGR